MAPWIISHFPAHRTYVEPYGGAASVLMRKPRSYGEVYNDLDEDVVTVFRVLRDPALALDLADAMALTPFARTEFNASYETCDDPVERARRILVRSFMAHGTTWQRRNRTGFRARPFTQTRAASRTFGDWSDHVESWVSRLQGVVIERRPALEVIAQQDAHDTLFYVDPPYVLHTRTNGAAYRRERAYVHNLSDDEHRELAQVLRSIEGMAVVSGYPSELYDEVYASWRRVDSPQQTDAGIRTECLWINPHARRGVPALFDRWPA